MKFYEYDLIIVGGGAAGLCAALSAKERCGGSVVLLEAAEAPGGNSAFAPMPALADYDLPDTVLEKRYLDKMEADNWESDARIVSTVINRSAKSIRWLYRITEGCSGSLTEKLASACRRDGIDIMVETRVQSLLRDGRNWTCGVTAMQHGESVVVSGKAVVLACGGFLGAEDLMQKYYPLYDADFEKEIVLQGHKATGDGVRLALAAGAGDDCTATFELGTDPAPFYSGTPGPVARKLIDNSQRPEGVWVNNVGVRFTNEAAPASLQAVYRQPNKEFYVIYDAGVIEALHEKDPEISLEALNAEMPELIAGDEAIVTEHLGAITAWLRGKTHITFHTLERYNECCEAGHDFLFGKDPRYLIPFRKPPFYGFKLGLSMRSTHGPIRTNPMMAVVDRFDAPIPALIACGADVAGLYRGRFVQERGTDSIMYAITTGIIAGDHAAGFCHGMGPAAPCTFPKFTAEQVLAGDYYNVGVAPEEFAVLGGIIELQPDGSKVLRHVAESADRQGLLRDRMPPRPEE